MKLNRLGPSLITLGTLFFPGDASQSSSVSSVNSQTRGRLERVLTLLRGENKSFLCPFTAASLEQLAIKDMPAGLAIGGPRRTYQLSQVETTRDRVKTKLFHLQSAGDTRYPTGICIDFDGDPKTHDIHVDECPAQAQNQSR